MEKEECCKKCHCNEGCALKGRDNCCHDGYCECHKNRQTKP